MANGLPSEFVRRMIALYNAPRVPYKPRIVKRGGVWFVFELPPYRPLCDEFRLANIWCWCKNNPDHWNVPRNMRRLKHRNPSL